MAHPNSVGRHQTTLNLDGEQTVKEMSFHQVSFLSGLDDPQTIFKKSSATPARKKPDEGVNHEEEDMSCGFESLEVLQPVTNFNLISTPSDSHKMAQEGRLGKIAKLFTPGQKNPLEDTD